MIQFSNVTKIYPTGETVLNDITFEIEQGEFVVLVGPSGAGKTSVMRILIKDLIPSSGTVMFQEQDLSKLSAKHIPLLRQQISTVFQDLKILTDRTIGENIALPLEITGKKQAEIDARVEDLLELVGLEGRAAYFPKQLSGGELQRVAIARALATGPKIILADEPTGNLDRDNALGITRLLKKIQELGTTIIMSTHNHSVIDLLKTRMIHLDQGELIKDTKVKTSMKQTKPAEEKSKEKDQKSDESKNQDKNQDKEDKEKESDKQEKSKGKS